MLKVAGGTYDIQNCSADFSDVQDTRGWRTLMDVSHTPSFLLPRFLKIIEEAAGSLVVGVFLRKTVVRSEHLLMMYIQILRAGAHYSKTI